MEQTTTIKIYASCPQCGHWCVSNASTGLIEKISHVDSYLSEIEEGLVQEEKTKLGKFGWNLFNTVAHIPATLIGSSMINKDKIGAFQCSCGKKWVDFGCSHDEWIKKVETDIALAESNVPIEKTYEMLRTIFSYYNVEEEFNDKLFELYLRLKDIYIREFCKIPNYARRFVWVQRNDITAYPKNICLFTQKEATIIGTCFDNEITTGVLYIKHPYKEKYYPTNRYSLALFEDEVEDFIDIMACVGAKEITTNVKDESLNNNNEKFSSTTTFKGAFSDVNLQGSEDYERSEEKRFHQLFKKIEHHHFNSVNRVRRYPNTGEFAWYDARERWRRKVARVLEYGELTMDFTLSIQEEMFMSQSETDAIQIDIQRISSKTSAEITNTEKTQSIFGKNHHRELIAHVEFYGEEEIKSENLI